jgi:hypothetical protein
MKTKLKALAAVVVLLSVSALTFAAVDGLSVKRQPKEGQTVKLRLKAQLEIAGNQATFTGIMQQKVTKVETDGTYTEEEQQLQGKASFGGQDVDVPDTGAHPVTYFADGSIKEIKGDDQTAGAAAYRMSNLGVIVDAGKPLNVGDTWTYDFKADSKTGAVAAKGEYKVLAEEKVGDLDTVKVKAAIKEADGTDPASSDGTYWISKLDGTLVKAEIKWLNAPFPGAPGPITATVSMVREL